MSRHALKLLAALLALGASALLARTPAAGPLRGPTAADAPFGAGAGAGAADDAAADAGDDDDEPLVRALRPLGPLRTIVTSALWMQMLQGQMEGDAERTSAVARALLALHPGLATVREYVAAQLLVTEAPRAPDRARHDALVGNGLSLYEDGLARPGGEALHAPFGRTLAVQSMVDPRFAAAAERVLGEMPEDRALRELLLSGPEGFDRWLAANLAVEHGLSAWHLDGDRRTASRDLALASRLLPFTQAEAIESGDASPGAEADEIIERAGNLVAPLAEALRAAAPPPRRAGPDADVDTDAATEDESPR